MGSFLGFSEQESKRILNVRFVVKNVQGAIQRTLTYFVRGSVTVLLTSCLMLVWMQPNKWICCLFNISKAPECKLINPEVNNTVRLSIMRGFCMLLAEVKIHGRWRPELKATQKMMWVENLRKRLIQILVGANEAARYAYRVLIVLSTLTVCSGSHYNRVEWMTKILGLAWQRHHCRNKFGLARKDFDKRLY